MSEERYENKSPIANDTKRKTDSNIKMNEQRTSDKCEEK